MKTNNFDAFNETTKTIKRTLKYKEVDKYLGDSNANVIMGGIILICKTVKFLNCFLVHDSISLYDVYLHWILIIGYHFDATHHEYYYANGNFNADLVRRAGMWIFLNNSLSLCKCKWDLTNAL